MKKNKLFKKFLIIMILIALTYSDWCVLGDWLVTKANSYLGDLQVTNNRNVKFDIGIKENDKLLYEKAVNINDKLVLTAYLAVENDGYLKDVSINFGDEERNYNITSIIQQNDIVKSSTQNEIKLKQILKGEIASLDIIIEWSNKFVNINDLNKTNSIKLTAVYVDANGRENKVEKNVDLKINWTCKNDIKLESEITKYTDYELENEKGILIEQAVKLSQNAKNKLPFEKVELSIEELRIDDKKADLVIIKNGNNEIPFENTDNEIKISEELKNNQEEIEYKLIYIFKDIELKEDLELGLKVKANARIVSEEDGKQVELQTEKAQVERKGDLVQLENTKLNEISKGRFYANCNQEEPQYETNYNLEYVIKISYKADIEKIKITNKEDAFTNEEGKEYRIDNQNILCNFVKINKDNLHYILGEEGYIEIFNIEDELIGKIDKTSKIDDNGNYYLEFEQKPNQIYLLTSTLQNAGDLNIIQNKTILPNKEYSKEEIKKFKNLDNKTDIELIEKDNEYITKIEGISLKNTLLETSTEAQMELSTNKLASIIKNENVEIKIELKNNNESRDLYKNPRFEIEFPTGIKDITIKEANLLFDNELKIEKIEKVVRDEKLVLIISLTGTQTKFLLEEYIKGTTIVLNTDIDVDIRTISKTDNILMKYYNENAVSYNKEDCGEYEYQIEYISPKQMIVGQEISGYNENEKVTSILQGEKSAKLEIYTEAKTVQNNIFIMNNNTYDCEGLTVLVRIPAKGNKNVVTGEDLGTTLDTKLLGIQVEGLEEAQIYYSTNEGANTDLELQENKWSASNENLQDVKTFMIKTSSKIEQGKIINVKYNYEIPANLEHNMYLFGDVRSIL